MFPFDFFLRKVESFTDTFTGHLKVLDASSLFSIRDV